MNLRCEVMNMEHRKFMEDERIYLRPLIESDVYENYMKWFDDAEVCQFNGHHVYPYSVEEMLDYIKSVQGSKCDLVLAIVDRVTNTHIGNIALQGIDYVSRQAALSFVIGEKAYWSKGYGQAAGRLVIEHAFNSLNLYRISLGTHEENVSMMNLALKLGFKQEGIRRKAQFKNGRYSNIIEFGLLREEWIEPK